ncbi:50S ribosomal protein L5 [Candidatus Roizmanbacteria bacterium]|nr:50S ribosomal protein L5 [Candidatus Roizmanbacteria bacterium]
MTLHELYNQQVVTTLMNEFGIANALSTPKINKIVVSMSLGEALSDKKILETMGEQLALITGQKPLTTRARRSIATFKLRAGMPIGLKVTIRGKRMWAFLHKLITIVFPRVRDFRGISPRVFDGRGNLNVGFSEMTVFPEIQYEKLDTIRGLEVTITTSSGNDKMAYRLLQLLGMPFEKGN